MRIDKELGTFGPDWLVDTKCRQVTNLYMDKMSKDVRDDLKKLMPSSARKSDMVDFLSGDGEILWNRFVADLTSSEGSRDYTPFSLQEAEALNTRIDLAFGIESTQSHRGASNPPGDAAIPSNSDSKQKRQKAAAGSRARLATGIGLLMAGFIIIFFTFIYLPGITRQFQEIRNAGINTEVNENLQAVMSQLRAPEFSDLSSQIQQLESNFVEVEGALNSFRAFAGQVNQAQELSETASSDLLQQVASIESLAQRTEVIVQQYEARQVASAAGDGTAEASQEPNLGPGFEVTLRELVDQSRAMTTPDDMLAQIDAAAAALEVYETETVGLVTGLASVWDRDDRTTGWTVLTEEENAAINAIRDWNPEGQVVDPLQDLRRVVSVLANQPAVFAVPDGFIASVTALDAQFEELKVALSEFKEQVSTSNEVAVGLQGALLAQSENETLRQLSERSSQLFGTVSSASAVISQSRQTYENTAGVLEDLEGGAASLRGLAELQADLAFRGASPAVVLLLAIGGMFVTFGLTSLLKWVKDAEAVRTEEAWQNQARMYSILASGLLERGIDPTPLLGRLQSISINSEGERAIVKSPVSETIAEIAKAMQGAFRKS
ncbi:hypothetical protein KUV51_11985 [Tateyamaria omphalii]|uniref:hypothetical protein n=1 Tax=Tateyamaria omphalii TaxID=299262 RepID=UPI001C999CFE|nr:hypothetical protein [Tateyamaria omphalii]MBY5933722.1 hypothetical protein [Tateyamaria omphalii]